LDSSSPSALPLDDVVGAYLNSTRQAAEAALASSNTAVNWSLTLTLGVMAFTIQFILPNASSELPTLFFTLLVLAVTIAMIAHFAIRTAKGYINVVRFAALERAALAQVMMSSSIPLDEKLQSYTNFANFVQTYHMLWKSPVSLQVVFRKVLFEFGYLYHVALLATAFGYVTYLSGSKQLPAAIIVLFLLGIVIIFEISRFLASAYGRYVNIDALSEDLA
jgi:hypothetical protein